MDRRKNRRYDVDLFVSVELDKDRHNSSSRFASRTTNVSSGGAYIVADAPLKEGTPVQLELFLAVERLLSVIGEKQRVKVRVKGEVIRSGDYGMAVRFDRGYKFTTLSGKGESN